MSQPSLAWSDCLGILQEHISASQRDSEELSRAPAPVTCITLLFIHPADTTIIKNLDSSGCQSMKDNNQVSYKKSRDMFGKAILI